MDVGGFYNILNGSAYEIWTGLERTNFYHLHPINWKSYFPLVYTLGKIFIK